MDRSYEVYRYYLALKLHFTTDKYDVVKQRGRVKASRQAFLKRKDLFSLKKVAESYSEKEIVEFLVANFTSGDRWGGLFDIDARNRYLSWKKRIESLSYTFEKEISNLSLSCEKNNIPFESCFKVRDSDNVARQHPLIIKHYLRNDVSIETLVILNKFYDYVSLLDKELDQDIIWPDLSRVIKKYEPFLTIEKEKYANLLRRGIGHN